MVDGLKVCEMLEGMVERVRKHIQAGDLRLAGREMSKIYSDYGVAQFIDESRTVGCEHTNTKFETDGTRINRICRDCRANLGEVTVP